MTNRSIDGGDLTLGAIRAIISALRPFALMADSMQTLKDEDRIGGLEVRYFRNAARILHEIGEL